MEQYKFRTPARSRGKSYKANTWLNSPEFNQIRLSALHMARAKIAISRKCNAKRRSDGEACQNLPSANGRCRFHGGTTPSGKYWHKVQWRANSSEEQLNSKLQRLSQRRNLNKKQIAAMSPAQKAAYIKWQKTHSAGSAADRALRRHKADSAAWFRSLSKTVKKLI